MNGLWVKQDEPNGEKAVFKHSAVSLYLHADTRACCHGNWHISPAIEEGTTLYWAGKSPDIPLQKGQFMAGGEADMEMIITVGKSSGKNFILKLKLHKFTLF